MRSLILTLVFGMIALLFSPGAVWADAGAVKSYREWKRTKVVDAQNRLEGRKHTLSLRKKDPNVRKKIGIEGRDLEATRLLTEIRNDEMELETALELTVSDYFAGYLTKLSNKNVYKDVAGRLTPDEVAELMAAYANSVFGTQTSQLPASALNMDADGAK